MFWTINRSIGQLVSCILAVNDEVLNLSQEDVTLSQYIGTVLLVMGTILNKAVDIEQAAGVTGETKQALKG